MWSSTAAINRVHLKTLPTSGARVLRAPENAGAVDIGNERSVLNRSNHPSFIDRIRARQPASVASSGTFHDGRRPSLMTLRFGSLADSSVSATWRAWWVGLPATATAHSHHWRRAGLRRMLRGQSPRQRLLSRNHQSRWDRERRREGRGQSVYYVIEDRTRRHSEPMAQTRIRQTSREAACRAGRRSFMEKLLPKRASR